MGVQGLKPRFKQIFPHCSFNLPKGESISCDHVLIDFNSLLHGAASLSTKPQFFKQILRKLDHVMGSLSPKQSVYIFVDGVSPLCRLANMRKRRKKNLKKTINSSTELKLSMTPGSILYSKVKGTLVAWAAHYIQRRNHQVKVHISGDDESGEGEVKAVSAIYNLPKNDSFVFVSDDGDALLIGMTVMRPNLIIFGQDRTGFDMGMISAALGSRCSENEPSRIILDLLALLMLSSGNDTLNKARYIGNVTMHFKRYIKFRKDRIINNDSKYSQNGAEKLTPYHVDINENENFIVLFDSHSPLKYRINYRLLYEYLCPRRGIAPWQIFRSKRQPKRLSVLSAARSLSAVIWNLETYSTGEYSDWNWLGANHPYSVNDLRYALAMIIAPEDFNRIVISNTDNTAGIQTSEINFEERENEEEENENEEEEEEREEEKPIDDDDDYENDDDDGIKEFENDEEEKEDYIDKTNINDNQDHTNNTKIEEEDNEDDKDKEEEEEDNNEQDRDALILLRKLLGTEITLTELETDSNIFYTAVQSSIELLRDNKIHISPAAFGILAIPSKGIPHVLPPVLQKIHADVFDDIDLEEHFFANKVDLYGLIDKIKTRISQIDLQDLSLEERILIREHRSPCILRYDRQALDKHFDWQSIDSLTRIEFQHPFNENNTSLLNRVTISDSKSWESFYGHNHLPLFEPLRSSFSHGTFAKRQFAKYYQIKKKQPNLSQNLQQDKSKSKKKKRRRNKKNKHQHKHKGKQSKK